MTQNANTGKADPRLVSAYNNVGQAFVATLPLLGVFVFFLYEAAVRPREPIYALEVDDDVAIGEAWEETPPMIALIDMIPVFLAFQGVFSVFFVYLTVYIPRRRRLLMSYLEKGESCLGDVVYDGKPQGLCSMRAAQYADVAYAYPNTTDWTIRKRARVYQHYSRERVTIVRLLNRPFSGQPKIDVQIDLQSSKAASKAVKALAVMALVWIAFTFIAPIFILYQMTKLRHDDYENFDKALNIYLIVGLGVIPAVSVMGVYLRWAIYRHWVVNRGWLLKSEGDTEIGMGAQDEGAVRVFVTELIGIQHPEEVPLGRDGSLIDYTIDTGTQDAPQSGWKNTGSASITTI